MKTLARSLSFLAIAVAVATRAPMIAQAVPAPPPPTFLWALARADHSCGLSVHPDPILRLGAFVTIKNGCDSGTQTIYQREGFWTVTLADGAEKKKQISGSGTYLSAVVPGQWHAPIKVLPRAPTSPSTDSFGVTWAVDPSPPAWRYGVQYRIGQGLWKPWKSGTALRSAIFNGVNGRTYFFRARTIREAGKATDWSPGRKVVT